MTAAESSYPGDRLDSTRVNMYREGFVRLLIPAVFRRRAPLVVITSYFRATKKRTNAFLNARVVYLSLSL